MPNVPTVNSLGFKTIVARLSVVGYHVYRLWRQPKTRMSFQCMDSNSLRVPQHGACSRQPWDTDVMPVT